MASTLAKQKGVLRKAMRATLANLTSEEIQAQSRQITRTLLALPEFQQSRSVSCYLSMPTGEVDTSAVVAAIFDAGKTLYVPKMLDKERGIMDFLQIFGEHDLHTLPAGQWGIREPDEVRDSARRPSGHAEPLELIVMPGMAFDRSLSRLGYGRGFYDRFLAAYAQAGAGSGRGGRQRPRLVALALREQILEAGLVPVGETDWKVDVIIGPDGIVQS
ncbi:5-formyltetrahydrofolate cyclo-ligase [Trametes versicolor FP-101664 SS1]|uniref:5-formyltetrahydrofolate cyclo-ligase n=1 Tax=Trametes versicolor (strain FP-101664) TaxID=717944 RepID=UPI000462194E|nr:5-formyltetrahydrofolate cyclo-ligase [Trametes versicolor FP-101664 SS1]EIW55007.1 5-formyltetrahydrofolate cyclo-ligase [Trametes versicolor FP-101664 SS1]